MSKPIDRGVPRRQFLLSAGAATAGAALTRFGGDVTAASARGRRGVVNDGDLLAAIRLGCHTMQSVFNADDGDIPWFGHHVVPYAGTQTRFLFSSAFQEAHVPGRHLNGLLEARSLGVEVDEAAIGKHRDAAYFSLSREVALPQNRPNPDADRPHMFLTHNIREGMHAMYALYRHSPANAAEARRRMERMIEAIDRFWTPRRAWSHDELRAAQPDINIQEWDGPFVSGVGRAIGPLANDWNATRERGEESRAARRLLVHLRETAMEHFTASGVGRNMTGHTHSITCTMSGLAQLADFTDDRELLDRVHAYYRVGSTDLRDELGWSQENMGDNSDRGEANNSGDILETALILGRHGHPECFADAERTIRCHLLPSQVVDHRFIQSPPDPWNDSVRDVGPRTLGAFGFPAPYGHRPRHHYAISFNMDIVGGATASLCAAQREITRRDADVTTVQLWLDAETEHATIESPYGSHGQLRITPRAEGAVRVVLPRWVDPSAVKVPGWSRRRLELDDAGGLVIHDVPAGRRVPVHLDLPEREIDLGHRYSGIRVRLRGDQVTAMESFGQELAYFPPLPSRPLRRRSRGLVGRWRFGGAANPVPDESGTGNPATLYGTARITGDGPPGAGGALALDGGGFAGIGTPSELNFGADSFTIALWMRSRMNGIGRMISRGSYIWTPGYFLSIGHGGSGRIGAGLGAGQRSGGIGSVEIFTRANGFNDGRWHHVALIVDRSRGRVQIVVDGAVMPVDQAGGTLGGATDAGLVIPAGAPIVASSRNALCVGSHIGQAELFDGAIADVRMFDRALSPGQVSALR